MINEYYKEMTGKGSVIRQFFTYANQKAAEIGKENIYNFSIGNPSVPVPQAFTDRMIELLQNENPVALHGYSPSLGLDETRSAVAASLNRRFNMNYGPEHIFMTSAAASAIAHAVRCVVKEGDEVITFAPYFPEYVPYIEGAGAKLTVVPADIESFQINFEEFEKALNPKVQAVLINSPNNPSGIVYSSDTIRRLAETLRKKQVEYGHDIYLISDEPYREIVFAGVDAPFISSFYENTICCYSFSKSVSLPGERIGYMAVNPACKDAELLVLMAGQISRFTGHNCPPSIIQMAVEAVLDQTSDLSIYETNKNILYKELTRIGYHIVEPGGTFYMFPRALSDDANEFCWRAAKELNLIIVPGDSFCCPGHFRISYCVTTDMVERSIPLFEKLYQMYK
ncbi:MAG: pyridoxal phosphate-dependent aminotransferase [Wujia sp.]